MFKAMVLICHVTLAPPACNIATAEDVIVAPQAADGAGCLFQAMAYAAEVAPRIGKDHYAKIVCTEENET